MKNVSQKQKTCSQVQISAPVGRERDVATLLLTKLLSPEVGPGILLALGF